MKTAGLLPAIALLMAAPGWTQTPTLVVQSTVSISSNQGSSVPVTSSVPGTEITFSAGAPVYVNDNGGAPQNWLSVQGGGTTPTNMSFNVGFTAGLIQGPHQATVTLTPSAPANVAAVTITVNFTTGSSGGGNGTLTAFPSPVNVSAASGSQFTTSVSITTTSTTAITLGVSAATQSGATNWLTASFTGSNTVVVGSPVTIQVTSNASNLSNGSYTGTVTVTPSAGTVLTIPVNFTVGGNGGGNGSWTVTPNSIPFNYNNGGNFPNPVGVVVTTTTGATTYNATASSSNGWLLINGSQTANGLTVGGTYSVSVGSQAASLVTGSYQGTVTINDTSGFSQATISVTLNVNGGNSSGLTLNPNPVSLTSLVGGVQQNPSVSVFSSSGGTLSVTGNLQSWVTVLLPSNTSVAAGGSTSFTINVNPTGLVAGTYGQVLIVAVGSQSSTLNVNLVVGSGGTGGGGTVSPTSLSFSYQTGTPPAAVAQQKIVIPAGNWSSALTTTSGGSWLQLTPLGGISVPDSASSPTAYVLPSGLAVGSYAGNIAITTGSGVQNVAVSLTVTQGPVLVPTPGSLVFVAQTGTVTQGQQVFFSTTDPVTAPVGITATANNPWITVSSATPGSMLVTVDPTGLAAGIYSGSVSVIQGAVANTPYSYPVLMVVNGGGSSSGPLNFTPSSLSFSSANGVTTPSQTTLTVGANVATNFTYSSSVFGNVANWINISPSNNGSATTTTNLSVSVNASGLPVGNYSGSITFSSNSFLQTVPVSLTVTNSSSTGGNVTVNPTSFSYSGQFGATSLATQALLVSSASGTAPVTFSVTATTTTGGSWLSTSGSSSLSTPSTVTVTANPSGLATGTYNGNLAVQPTGGSLVNVPVTLTISAPVTVSATPTALTFTYRAGDSNPASQAVTIAGAGLSYSATAVSTGNWLSVSPATGTAPGTVSVAVNGSGLIAGTYSGTVTIAGTNGATGTTTVTVSLTVTAPLPTITKVTNSASYVTGTLSPGEIITLFAGDPTHPIGPATATGLTIDSSTGLVSTTSGGVQVLISGFACPMIYASASQVSAVVPYQLAQFTSATVQIKYLGQTSNGVFLNMVTTVPGIFTANASGSGPGAILNSNNTTNAPGNPAARGDTVVVYMTGEGQTSPAGVTGKVTAVSATPPLTPAPLLPISITVGGQPANYSFAGEAPGIVSGVLQLNVQLPTNIATGEQEILVTIGGNQTQRGVTVSVK